MICRGNDGNFYSQGNNYRKITGVRYAESTDNNWGNRQLNKENLGHNMGTAVKLPVKKQKVKRTQRISNPVGVLKKRLYSIRESAEYLGRSVWSVRELIYSGRLPCVKVGRRIHLDIIDLDKWIERNKVTTFL